jgi:hypothetical protein
MSALRDAVVSVGQAKVFTLAEWLASADMGAYDRGLSCAV